MALVLLSPAIPFSGDTRRSLQSKVFLFSLGCG
jgi:hypothetical protein